MLGPEVVPLHLSGQRSASIEPSIGVDVCAESIARDRYHPVTRLFLEARARPPLFLWEPTFSDLRSQRLVELLVTWRSLAVNGVVDERAFMALDIGAMRDWTMHVRVLHDGDDFLYERYGDEIARYYGRSNLGETVTDHAGHIWRFFAACYRAVVRRPEPLLTEHSPPQGILVASWRRLILPLCNEEGQVTSFIVGNIAEQPLRSLMDTIPEPALTLGDDGLIVAANQVAADLLGTDFRDLVNVEPPDHVRDLLIQLEALDGAGRASSGEPLTITGLDGELRHIIASIKSTEQMGMRVRVAVLRDVTSREQVFEKFRTLAMTDPLTGLANRRALMDGMREQLQQPARANTRTAVLLIDLDGFKAVNDHFGHDVGDRMLKRVAGAIREVVRADDLVARFGGDEFALLQTAVRDVGDVHALGRKLLDVVRRSVPDGPNQPKLSISIGASLFPDQGSTPESLLKAADRALYNAKRSGRDRMCLEGVRPQAQIG
ncbi:MAG: diguanylate cyclase domain-containing protein [Geminicoccaceae bacterium]